MPATEPLGTLAGRIMMDIHSDDGVTTERTTTVSDFEALMEVLSIIPPGLSVAARTRLDMMLRRARQEQYEPRIIARGTKHGTYVMGMASKPDTQTMSPYVGVLCDLVVRPREWVRLPSGKSLGTYSEGIGRALKATRRVDDRLADALAQTSSEFGPGTRLRTAPDGGIEARWTPGDLRVSSGRVSA